MRLAADPIADQNTHAIAVDFWPSRIPIAVEGDCYENGKITGGLLDGSGNAGTVRFSFNRLGGKVSPASSGSCRLVGGLGHSNVIMVHPILKIHKSRQSMTWNADSRRQPFCRAG